MGSLYTLRCDKCGYSVRTSGPWEFYRDESGTRKPYGHPAPCSREAARRGIYGLSADLYCPACDSVSDVILVEFKQPSSESLSVWGGQCEPMDEYKREGAVRCPNCNNQRMTLSGDESGEVSCPRCSGGVLRGRMDLIA